MNRQLLDEQRVEEALQRSWTSWLDEVVAEPVVRGSARNVGTLSPETVAGMQRAGVTPRTALIGMRDEQLVPLVKAATTEPGVNDALAGLALADLRRLPQALAQPQAVLHHDHHRHAGLRVRLWPARGGRLSMIVNYLLQGSSRSCTVQSGSVVGVEQLGQQLANGRSV
ncbi:hypothetical protein P4124_00015 [Pseudomonas aeruginosa]|nr:hypothetical protein [Pseudomonas aeruginosa]